MKKNKIVENIAYIVFLIFGMLTIACVLLITVYLIVSGIPAIKEIGLINFLFGKKWASTAQEPAFGILPFILTSVYGTAAATVLAVPVGLLSSIYISRYANKKVRLVIESFINMLASIPSVVVGLIGMVVLVPTVAKVFSLSDGATLASAIVVLTIMILPNVIKVSVTSLDAVKKEYEDGITVAELIVKENVENPEYVTVTVNDDFVERDDFETTKLNEGDAVEFLYFMGGGAY